MATRSEAHVAVEAGTLFQLDVRLWLTNGARETNGMGLKIEQKKVSQREREREREEEEMTQT